MCLRQKQLPCVKGAKLSRGGADAAQSGRKSRSWLRFGNSSLYACWKSLDCSGSVVEKDERPMLVGELFSGNCMELAGSCSARWAEPGLCRWPAIAHPNCRIEQVTGWEHPE